MSDTPTPTNETPEMHPEDEVLVMAAAAPAAPPAVAEMLSLTGLVSAKAQPVPPTRKGFRCSDGAPELVATIRYISQADAEEMVESNRAKLLSDGRMDSLTDMRALQKISKRAIDAFLAYCVLSIEHEDPQDGSPKPPVTVGDLSAYLPYDIEAMKRVVASRGGDPNAVLMAPVSMDTSSTEPVPGAAKVGGKPLTRGDEARRHILMMVQHCSAFREWVRKVCGDLSHFQDESWADQLKN
jgi:hypothetical protein